MFTVVCEQLFSAVEQVLTHKRVKQRKTVRGHYH
jgi:hypothetical protein